MTKAFTKGQEVTFFQNYDSKGSVAYQHAVVYSCGKKQMVLTHAETGVEMGRHYKPELGTLEGGIVGNVIHMPGGTFPRMTDEEAVEAGLKIAAAVLKIERERLEHCLKIGGGADYDAAIQKQIDALHEPRVIRR